MLIMMAFFRAKLLFFLPFLLMVLPEPYYRNGITTTGFLAVPFWCMSGLVFLIRFTLFGTCLFVVCCLAYSLTMRMEVFYSSEAFCGLYQITWGYNSEDYTLHGML
jgi:hypothetical protein